MEAVNAITRPAGVRVIEDCAQAHGAKRGGRRAGSFGNVATFSFYPTKNLGAIGDAGAVITAESAVAADLRRLRQYGWETKYRAVLPGGRNSRLDELQAAILRAKLPFLEEWNVRRREIATMYSAQIRNPRVRCPPARGTEYVAHLYVVLCEDREGLKKHLADRGISTDVHYPVPDYRQPAIEAPDWSLLPRTEAASARILTLPCFPELRADEMVRIVDAINEWNA
jgi:dTDP-4-amino-4,6-dideoxygalactose transaminase